MATPGAKQDCRRLPGDPAGFSSRSLDDKVVRTDRIIARRYGRAVHGRESRHPNRLAETAVKFSQETVTSKPMPKESLVEVFRQDEERSNPRLAAINAGRK